MIYSGRASLHTSIPLTLHLGRVKTAYMSCKEAFFVRAQKCFFTGHARPLCSTQKELSSLYKIFTYTGTKALEILLLRYHPYCRF